MKLPDWAESGLRPHQTDAVADIVSAYRDGAEAVVLDAPTGSGKTLIAEVVRQEMGWDKTAYVCTDKALQDQFAKDFEYAKVAKGRGNYPVSVGKTADDCGGTSCGLCKPTESCPYRVAKMAAMESELACLNTNYVLSNFPFARGWRKDGIIFDECDMLPAQVLGAGEFRFGIHRSRKLGLTIPKGSQKHLIKRYLRAFIEKATSEVNYTRDPKEKRQLNSKIKLARKILKMEDDEWARVKSDNSLIIKPLVVDGEHYLWSRAEQFLLMSGSVVDYEGLMRIDLDFDGDLGLVEVPMTFPKENRQIHVSKPDLIPMGYQKDDLPAMAGKIRLVLENHPDWKILVHCVSYARAKQLHELVGEGLIYHDSNSKQSVLDAFRDQFGGVLFAASMDRGVDLPEVDCVIVAKIPYPNMRDEVVRSKQRVLPQPQFWDWYNTQTIRTLLQMTGRHVRSKTDVGVTIILDDAFPGLYSKNRNKFPAWWREAIQYAPQLGEI